MKKVLLYMSFLILTICMGCPPDSDTYPVKEITYEAMTRGQFETIHVKSNILTYKTRTESKETTLSSKQLKALYKVLKPIKHKEVDALKAPSGKRLYDGAMAAVVIFKTQTETYQSSSFDDDNPPSELKKLVRLLKSFIK
ncbi:hypothetical protein RQM59_03425 [Flavobacteriaceae bacterium S356]|uniref:Lipoprotein n=1 Tax=Asprobacillus argus TaxID=3076534 RepID=A0ABU3LDY4_9FLAO|nr:hypothetical protein [Flavobacteriaceae bacterium S356]